MLLVKISKTWLIKCIILSWKKTKTKNQLIMLRYRQQIVEEVVYGGQY